MVNSTELSMLLNGPHDKNSAIWKSTQVLGVRNRKTGEVCCFVWYMRWVENMAIALETVDYQDGDEAGLNRNLSIEGLEAAHENELRLTA